MDDMGELVNALRVMDTPVSHELAEWVAITIIKQAGERDREWNEWIDGRDDRAWTGGPKLGEF